MNSPFVEVMSALALRTGMRDRVTASHTTAMHSYNGAYASKLLRFCAKRHQLRRESPWVNIHLQGRIDTYPQATGADTGQGDGGHGGDVSLGHDDISTPGIRWGQAACWTWRIWRFVSPSQ